MNEQTLVFLIVGLSSFVVGWILGVRHLASKIQEAIEFIENNPEKVEELFNKEKISIVEIPMLTTESCDDTILLYDKNKNNFYCQGSTLEDVAKNLWSYKKIDVAIVNHNDDIFWFVGGKIETVKPA